MSRCICQIYRSRRHEGMYLFVDKQEGLARVPDTLLARFGVPEPSFVFVLTHDRTLERVSAAQVLAALKDPGYYLMMPPKLTEQEPYRGA